MPLSAKVWLRLRPSLPQMMSNIGESVTWNPVATTIASTSRAVPSSVMMRFPVISRMPPVTRSTSSRSSAGYQSLVISMRLHPIRKFGVTLRRNSGSRISARILTREISSKSFISAGFFASPTT
nr:hypothetical protein CPGR_03033 [Mycolicibacterium malmesburyense]